MALLARDVQRGSAAASRRPDARAGFYQQPRRLGLPVASGPGEQRVLPLGVVPRVELGRERCAARPLPGEEGAQPEEGEAGWALLFMPPQKEESLAAGKEEKFRPTRRFDVVRRRQRLLRGLGIRRGVLCEPILHALELCPLVWHMLWRHDCRVLAPR